MPPIVRLKCPKHKRPIRLRRYLLKIISILVAPIIALHPALIIVKNFAPVLVEMPFFIGAKRVCAIVLKRNLDLTWLIINEQRPFTRAQARITTRPFSIILRHFVPLLSISDNKYVTLVYLWSQELFLIHNFFTFCAGGELTEVNSKPLALKVPKVCEQSARVACVYSLTFPCLAHVCVIIYENRVFNVADSVLWCSILDNMKLCEQVGEIFITPIFLCFAGALAIVFTTTHRAPRNDSNCDTRKYERIKHLPHLIYIHQNVAILIRRGIFCVQHVQPILIPIEVGDCPVHVEIDSFHSFPFSLMIK